MSNNAVAESDKRVQSDLDINQLLGYNINRVAILMRNGLTQCFKEYQINPEQWTALLILWQQDSISQSEIASITLQSPPAISNMIKRMIKNGYVTKQRDINSERTTIIRLTEKGRQMETELKEKWNESSRRIRETFPEQKINQFKKLLIDFRKSAGDLF